MVMVMLGVHNTLVIWGIGGPRTLEICHMDSDLGPIRMRKQISAQYSIIYSVSGNVFSLLRKLGCGCTNCIATSSAMKNLLCFTPVSCEYIRTPDYEDPRFP